MAIHTPVKPTVGRRLVDWARGIESSGGMDGHQREGTPQAHDRGCSSIDSTLNRWLPPPENQGGADQNQKRAAYNSGINLKLRWRNLNRAIGRYNPASRRSSEEPE